MKIKINNLGPIKKAEVDIGSNMTIFCGPNSSGKTYMAFLIYALTKSGFTYSRNKNSQSLIQKILQEKNAKYILEKEEIWKFRESEMKSIKESLGTLYGIPEDVVKSLFENFDVQIVQNKSDFFDAISKMTFKNSLGIKDMEISINKKTEEDYLEISLSKNTISKENIEFIQRYLEPKIFSLIAFYPFSSNYIFPVERNSIYTFSKELSIQKQDFFDRVQDLSTNFKKSDPIHWLLRRSTRYPLPIKDGLGVAEDLNTYTKFKSEFYSFAEEIENDLLFGKMIISKDGEVLFSSNKAKGKNIPIHLAASIVKTLSSLVFYLKHIANYNDLIIIDEPELNLHPDNQVLLARIFAKLINKGFRLLISTHSDYIIRELNNLIMLSNTSPLVSGLRQKFGYEHDEFIKTDQISAYLFNYKTESSKNVTISKMEITETGFDVKTMDETIDRLNLITEELFYSIKYQNDEDE